MCVINSCCGNQHTFVKSSVWVYIDKNNGKYFKTVAKSGF